MLTDPSLAGRLPGHTGYDKAARLMADEFRLAGLIPVAKENYFQDLEVEYNEILPPCAFDIILGDGTRVYPELGKDYTYRGFSGAGNFTASAVFAGYGISSDKLMYNDYANLDLKGKVAMVFRTNPGFNLPEGDWPEATPRQKALMAYMNGAIGVLLVAPPGDRENVPQVIGSVMDGKGEQLQHFPQLVISRQVADLILKESGKSVSMLQSEIESGQKPVSLELLSKVKINVKSKYQQKASTVNVVGLLPGHDPIRKNQYLVLGAHLDHVGSQCDEIYFPGANDNASGCAAVLEIAREFQRSGFRPAHSVLFVLFASEEQGLQGAEYFVNNCPVEKESIIAMLNFDCIAYGDSIQLGNGKSAPMLWKLASGLEHQNMLVNRTWSGGGADATPFHQADIPALYFVSTNSYGQLHSVTDTPQSLNPQLFTTITRLGMLVAKEIASGNYKGENPL